MSDAIRLLEWDSAFFGFAIAEVAASRVDEATLAAVEQACREQQIRCLYLLLDTDDARGIELAQGSGFVLRDVRITLGRPLRRDEPEGDGAEQGIAPARPDQQPVLEALAREAFTHTRFVTDPGFPADRARELYVAFLRRGFETGPQRVVLTDPAAEGFIIYHADAGADAEVATLELIAVHDNARGRGLGNALFRTATTALGHAGFAHVTAVTQAANVVTQRLHQRNGLRTHAVDLWFHRWFP
jgi:ribosomal protein S18 acetylase RimI-like enzyme